MTDPARMDATLDLLTADEIWTCLRFVQVMERGQLMSPTEADGRRILASVLGLPRLSVAGGVNIRRHET